MLTLPAGEIASTPCATAEIPALTARRVGSGVSPVPRPIDSVRTTLYNGPRILRVYPLIGGGVAEWLKAAVC